MSGHPVTVHGTAWDYALPAPSTLNKPNVHPVRIKLRPVKLGQGDKFSSSHADSVTVKLSSEMKLDLVKSSSHGHIIAQVVNRQLPTAAARVRSQLKSCGICGGVK